MLAERVFWTPIFIETTQFYHYSYYIVEETQVQRWERASQVALAVKNPLANAADMRDVGLIPGSGRSPAGGNGNPVSLPGEAHGQRNLPSYSPWDLTTQVHTGDSGLQSGFHLKESCQYWGLKAHLNLFTYIYRLPRSSDFQVLSGPLSVSPVQLAPPPSRHPSHASYARPYPSFPSTLTVS